MKGGSNWPPHPPQGKTAFINPSLIRVKNKFCHSYNILSILRILRILYEWQNLFLRITFLHSTTRSNDKNMEQLLAQNLHLLMLASSWMMWRKSFLNVRNYNLSFGSVISTIYIFIGVEFLNELTNFHFDLKFTYETSSCIVNFLDLNVSLRNGTIHLH